MNESLARKLVSEFKVGDILVTERFLYQHYGIYSGKGKVIHFSYENKNIGVHEDYLSEFTNGNKCRVIKLDNKDTNNYSPEETIARARSKIGQKGYNLLFNNCEHFAYWCKTGKNKSSQVSKAISTAVLLGAVILIGHLVANSDEYF